MKPNKTWILVADAAHARIFENLGPGKALRELPAEQIDQETPLTRELGSDRPGRTHDSTGTARHAKVNKADWHEQAKAEFAKVLADRLNAACQNKSFDRLILAAAPRILGQLRGLLSPKVTSLVAAELNKDLTGVAPAELESHIAKVAAI
ncbi:MAG: host attachment protein [Alphaproteobacteria bacterium]